MFIRLLFGLILEITSYFLVTWPCLTLQKYKIFMTHEIYVYFFSFVLHLKIINNQNPLTLLFQCSIVSFISLPFRFLISILKTFQSLSRNTFVRYSQGTYSFLYSLSYSHSSRYNNIRSPFLPCIGKTIHHSNKIYSFIQLCLIFKPLVSLLCN